MKTKYLILLSLIIILTNCTKNPVSSTCAIDNNNVEELNELHRIYPESCLVQHQIKPIFPMDTTTFEDDTILINYTVSEEIILDILHSFPYEKEYLIDDNMQMLKIVKVYRRKNLDNHYQTSTYYYFKMGKNMKHLLIRTSISTIEVCTQTGVQHIFSKYYDTLPFAIELYKEGVL